MSLRAKEIDSKLEVKLGEREVQVLTWKRIVLEFTGSRTIGSTIEKCQNVLYEIEQSVARKKISGENFQSI